MSPCPRWTAIPLGRASQRASRDQPGRQGGNAPASRGPWFPMSAPPAAPLRSCSRWGLPCRPRCRGRGALLPHRFTLACCERPIARGAISGSPELAVCFLWHFPWGRPRRPLAGTVFPWSPDFPPMPSPPDRAKRAGRKASAAVQPSGAAEMRAQARQVNAWPPCGACAPPTRLATASRRASVPASAWPLMASGRQWR